MAWRFAERAMQHVSRSNVFVVATVGACVHELPLLHLVAIAAFVAAGACTQEVPLSIKRA